MYSTTVVIPTYQRLDSLTRTIESILNSSLLLSEVIIIDDDGTPRDVIEKWNKEFSQAGTSFVYYHKDHIHERQGLSESKNIGMKIATGEILFYLDDDVVVERDYFAEIMKTWEEHREENMLFAVGGKISNGRVQSAREHWYMRFFGLKSDFQWDVTPVGFQAWNQSTDKTCKAHYIHGGVSSYRRDLLQQFGFVEFAGGRTSLEDVELGLRCKNAGYHFYYVPRAQLAHYHESSGREDRVLSGVKESRNRREIYRLHTPKTIKNKLWFVWSNTGWIIKKALTGNIRYTWGMIKGMVL